MARNKEIPRDWFVCPHCGADVLRGAKACKECGSDAETGWAPEAKKWDAEIEGDGYGGDDFDYNEFVDREFPEHAEKRPPWDRFVTARKVILLALIVLALLVLASIFGVRMR